MPKNKHLILKANETLSRYTKFETLDEVLKLYDKNDMSYHNRHHIMDMLSIRRCRYYRN